MPASRRSFLPGVNHPALTRISPTNYLLRYLNYSIYTTIHVAQIAEYVQFDEEIRTLHASANFTSVPIGYVEFSRAWNEGVAPNDPRRFSTISLADDPKDNAAYPSTYPVHLSEFHITPAQAGLVENARQAPSPQDDITHEFAIVMANRQKKERQFAEQRRQKKHQAFEVKTSTFARTITHTRPKDPSKRRNRNRSRNQKARPVNQPIPGPLCATETPQTPTETVATPEKATTSAETANPSTPMETAF